MYKIKCKCEKMAKNFKKNLGEFYIDKCCKAAGFDEVGKTKEDREEETTNIVDALFDAPEAVQVAEIAEENVPQVTAEVPEVEAVIVVDAKEAKKAEKKAKREAAKAAKAQK